VLWGDLARRELWKTGRRAGYRCGMLPEGKFGGPGGERTGMLRGVGYVRWRACGDYRL
jgi:hypothetical protein